MSEAWLKCELSKGMFPDEIGVSFKADNGEEISLFCFKDFVDTKSQRLRVKVIGKQDGQILVRLPVESLNGVRVIPVSELELTREMQAV